MYFVYILECRDGSLYTGITTDVERRFKEHKDGKGGRYTRAKKVKKLLYSEKQKDRSSASKRESAIKRLTRTEKLSLVHS
jgi:putative endonuclease